MEKFCKLILISENNNNKFYTMHHDGKSDVVNVEYGRIDVTSQKTSFHISLWESKYREKLKKGYCDVSELVSVTTTQELKQIGNSKVAALIELLKRYRDNLVRNTYSVKATSITPQQIQKAQEILSDIAVSSSFSEAEVNKKLISLYTTIPRNMNKVQHHLLPSIDLNRTLQSEQDNIDAVKSSVSVNTASTELKTDVTLLDVLGITVEECTDTTELDYLLKQSFGRKVEAVYCLNKASENETFDNWMQKQKNKETRVLIHGTRCSSVLGIFQYGLKIRPSGNFQFSGKVYGDSNYFSMLFSKSLGYCGHDNDKMILVYEVHTGNPYTYKGWRRKEKDDFDLNYQELQKRGYDSLFVEAGDGLLHSEICAYNEEQCRIKYLIHIK